jgi:hypothetical protein
MWKNPKELKSYDLTFDNKQNNLDFSDLNKSTL